MMRTTRRVTDESGFSLVELMVAMGFIAAGILSLGQLFVMSVKHADVGRKDTVAMNLASEIIERMRSEKYDTMVGTFDNIDTKVSASIPAKSRDWASHVTTLLGNGSRGRVDITNNAEGRNGLARVDVIMSWVDRGDTLNLTTTVFVSKMGA